MKHFAILLTLGLLTLGMSAQAQTRPAPRRAATPPPRPVLKDAGVKDGIAMKEGKVLVTENGHTAPLTAPETRSLTNGTKVQADGVVVMADGNTAQLQEGDYMSLSGRLTTARMKAQQDSLAQAARLDPKAKGKKKRNK